jgi:hypothetical protein
VPIFHNDYRGFNPLNGSNQVRGGDDSGHEEGISSILFTRSPLWLQAQSDRENFPQRPSRLGAKDTGPLAHHEIAISGFPLWNG